jgi:threonine synthase
MIKYVSNTGGGTAVDFETAILDGFAADGGLYVPEELPKISKKLTRVLLFTAKTQRALRVKDYLQFF